MVSRNGFACLASILVFFGMESAQAGNVTYRIADFSERYKATVTVDDSDEVFRPGRVSVFERSSGRRILKVEADELTVDAKGGVVGANVKQLPYGEQSVLIHEDFNFDGRKDLAIMDGQNSCYHGPSFQIFLATDSGFKASPEFTQLAQEYCGMFQVDASKRRLSTMTKDGCCWHQFNTYDVLANKPHLLESIEDSWLGSGYANYHQSRVSRGKAVTVRYFLENGSSSEPPAVLAFNLQGTPGKRVVLLISGNTLDYALLAGADRAVEFSYVLDVLGWREGRQRRHDSPPFVWDQVHGEISFRNGPYTYTIHDRPERLGVTVSVGKKQIFLAGDPASRQGKLTDLKISELENAIFKEAAAGASAEMH